jgi:hypothetical protein
MAIDAKSFCQVHFGWHTRARSKFPGHDVAAYLVGNLPPDGYTAVSLNPSALSSAPLSSIVIVLSLAGCIHSGIV